MHDIWILLRPSSSEIYATCLRAVSDCGLSNTNQHLVIEGKWQLTRQVLNKSVLPSSPISSLRLKFPCGAGMLPSGISSSSSRYNDPMFFFFFFWVTDFSFCDVSSVESSAFFVWRFAISVCVRSTSNKKSSISQLMSMGSV